MHQHRPSRPASRATPTSSAARRRSREDQMRRAAPSIFADRQAREPLRALHLHPDHRGPARPAEGRLRALHGRAEPEPHRGQDRVHQAHDPDAPCRAGQQARARGQRDHPDQQPRRRQLVPDAGRRVSLRLLQRPGLSATSANDIRIPHKGNVQDEVIEGAFRVLDDFEAVEASTEAMKALTLDADEERAFATAALALALRRAQRNGPAAGADHGRAADRGAPARGPRAQPLDDVPARPGERDPRRAAGPQRAGPAHPHPRGRAASTAA